jgi:hypothetical protein
MPARTVVAAIHPQGRAGEAAPAGWTGALIMTDAPDCGGLLSRANRASPMSRSRRFGSFSRQRVSNWRIAGGVDAGIAVQSGSRVMTAAMMSVIVSPENA